MFTSEQEFLAYLDVNGFVYRRVFLNFQPEFPPHFKAMGKELGLL